MPFLLWCIYWRGFSSFTLWMKRAVPQAWGMYFFFTHIRKQHWCLLRCQDASQAEWWSWPTTLGCIHHFWLFVICLVGLECSLSTSLGPYGGLLGSPQRLESNFLPLLGANISSVHESKVVHWNWYIKSASEMEFSAEEDTRNFVTLNNLHYFLWTNFSLCR